jgi:hypothetical protein
MLVFATSAMAQSSSVQGYNDEGGQVQAQIQPTSGGGNSGGGSSGSLPFTGLDLALIGAAGGLLVALGVGMRRLTRAPETT